tara:strand:- start:102 stop:476 length:375 start_codon:yes stop_codon:yes gene_type:complete
VAKRANVNVIKDNKYELEASHNGYSNIGITHNRYWIFEENKLMIYDNLNKPLLAKSYLHFHPSVKIHLKNSVIKINENITIFFENLIEIKRLNYNYNSEFNNPKIAQKVELTFRKDLKTIINID